MYASNEQDKTTGVIYANNRKHDEDGEVDSDKTAVFINHQATMTDGFSNSNNLQQRLYEWKLKGNGKGS